MNGKIKKIDPQISQISQELWILGAYREFCLGGIFRSTRNRQVNEVLAEAAKTPDEDAAVRAMAYAAIRHINGY